MIKNLLFIVLSIFILVACSQQEGEGITSETPNISLENVENVLSEHGFVLEKADVPSENVFIQELNVVSPNTYSLQEHLLSVYVFPSASERGLGIQEFEDRTATMELIEHKAYGMNNLLVFYVSEDEQVQNHLFESLKILKSPE